MIIIGVRRRSEMVFFVRSVFNLNIGKFNSKFEFLVFVLNLIGFCEYKIGEVFCIWDVLKIGILNKFIVCVISVSGKIVRYSI